MITSTSFQAQVAQARTVLRERHIPEPFAPVERVIRWCGVSVPPVLFLTQKRMFMFLLVVTAFYMLPIAFIAALLTGVNWVEGIALGSMISLVSALGFTTYFLHVQQVHRLPKWEALHP